MELLFNPEYETMWGALGTIAETIASIASIGALFYSIVTFRKFLMINHYTELDSAYRELLRLVMDRPHLATPAALADDRQRGEYDMYAFMLWNYLETIYDRCEKNHKLRETWYPIIATEMQIHGNWFAEQRNQPKFKEAFRRFIAGRGYER